MPGGRRSNEGRRWSPRTSEDRIWGLFLRLALPLQLHAGACWEWSALLSSAQRRGNQAANTSSM